MPEKREKTHGAAGGDRSRTRDGGFALAEPVGFWTPFDLKDTLDEDETRWRRARFLGRTWSALTCSIIGSRRAEVKEVEESLVPGRVSGEMGGLEFSEANA